MELIEEVKRAYAECAGFSCRSVFERHFRGDPPRTVKHQAVVLFARPDNLRVEWIKEPDKHRLRCIVASGPKISTFDEGDGGWADAGSLRDAIAEQAGVSGGLAAFIPSLLLGWDDFIAFEELRREPDTVFKGQHCLCLAGRRADRRTDLTICSKRYAILRMVDNYAISTCDVEEITTHSSIQWDFRPEPEMFTAGRILGIT